MTEENLARLNSLLSKQITNLETNVLLSSHEKVDLSGIIVNLCNGIASLHYALDNGEGEGWRDGNN